MNTCGCLFCTTARVKIDVLQLPDKKIRRKFEKKHIYGALTSCSFCYTILKVARTQIYHKRLLICLNKLMKGDGVKKMKPIAFISRSVVELLDLKLSPDTPVYIGNVNIEHIKSRHPYEFSKYFSDLKEIIEKPDYAGTNPKDGSILFVRLYKANNEYIRAAVRVAPNGVYYARTLHLLSTCNAQRYIAKGTLKKLDKPSE